MSIQFQIYIFVCETNFLFFAEILAEDHCRLKFTKFLLQIRRNSTKKKLQVPKIHSFDNFMCEVNFSISLFYNDLKPFLVQSWMHCHGGKEVIQF